MMQLLLVVITFPLCWRWSEWYSWASVLWARRNQMSRTVVFLVCKKLNGGHLNFWLSALIFFLLPRKKIIAVSSTDVHLGFGDQSSLSHLSLIEFFFYKQYWHLCYATPGLRKWNKHFISTLSAVLIENNLHHSTPPIIFPDLRPFSWWFLLCS